MVLRARAVGFDWLRVQALTDEVTRAWRRASMGRPSCQRHGAGERLSVDDPGKKPCDIDRHKRRGHPG
jgi:hypothetical protein